MTKVSSSKPDAVAGLSTATSTVGESVSSLGQWLLSAQGQVIAAVAIAAVITAGLLLVRRLLRRSLDRQPDARAWRTLAEALISRFHAVFALMVGLRVAVAVVPAPEAVDGAVRLLFTIASVLQGAIWSQAIAVELLTRYVRRHATDGSTVSSAFVLLRWLAAVVIWSIAILLLLDNLGVNVTALVAGLGVGGVAIALAAQSTIGNFFGAFSIISDKPFRRGDQIRVGGMLATVEEIGIRTTRLRAVDGHQIVITNSKLLEEPIENLQRLEERRAVVTVGIVYETAPDVVREVPDILRACVEDVETARFVRCHLAAFGPSSLDYELVFFARGSDYSLFMATRQMVLFHIFERFADRRIGIAYPTQTIYVGQLDGSPQPTEPGKR